MTMPLKGMLSVICEHDRSEAENVYAMKFCKGQKKSLTAGHARNKWPGRGSSMRTLNVKMGYSRVSGLEQTINQRRLPQSNWSKLISPRVCSWSRILAFLKYVYGGNVEPCWRQRRQGWNRMKNDDERNDDKTKTRSGSWRKRRRHRLSDELLSLDTDSFRLAQIQSFFSCGALVIIWLIRKKIWSFPRGTRAFDGRLNPVHYV